jgi:ATP-dependent Clp protease ATP-binding subunit ClpX
MAYTTRHSSIRLLLMTASFVGACFLTDAYASNTGDDSTDGEKPLLSHSRMVRERMSKRKPAAVVMTTSQTVLEVPSLEFQRISLKASELRTYLNERIIGQEEAMASFAAFVHMHFTSVALNKWIEENPVGAAASGMVACQKSNMLMIGQTGCGKSECLKQARHYLKTKGFDITIVDASASSLTRTGYVGLSVSDLLGDALRLNNYDVYKTENSTVIFADEIDKIAASTSERLDGGRDITGAAVQNEFLKPLQEDTIQLRIERTPGKKETFHIRTKNILFVGAGAFKKLHVSSDNRITDAALSEFGFSDEFVGRFQNRVLFRMLNQSDYLRVLRSDFSVIKEKQSLLKNGYGIDLTFSYPALSKIAEGAFMRPTGVRALTSIVEELVLPYIKDSERYEGKEVMIRERDVVAIIPHTPQEKMSIWYGKTVDSREPEMSLEVRNTLYS